MAFRFKDLMIQVVPQGQGGGDDPLCTLASKVPDPDPAALMPCTLASKPDELAARGCAEATEAQCTCTLATKQSPIPAEIACTLASRIIPRLPGTEGMAALGTITTVTTVTTVTTLVQGGTGGGDLASLKSQLRAALEDVERQERAQQGDGLPATVEEADDLERRLREAIEELQDHRKTLQQDEKAESPRSGRKGGAKKARGRK